MEEQKKVGVSYSQLSMYNQCELKWKLNYADKLGVFKDSIHLLFGTAIHTTLQYYLNVMYTETIQKADDLNLDAMLLTELKRGFTESFEKNNEYPCTKEQLIEFYQHGILILDFFKKHKNEYFSKKGFELLGCEIPLEIDLSENIKFVGFIDIAIKDKVSGKVYIKDFKTSTKGWFPYQQKDETKTQQLVLYKEFYSRKYDVPVDLIEVEYVILKRLLSENSQWPQKRVQLFSPASGTISIKKVMTNLKKFIQDSYNSDGTIKLDRQFNKDESQKTCKFCDFNGTQYCDAPLVKK